MNLNQLLQGNKITVEKNELLKVARIDSDTFDKTGVAIGFRWKHLGNGKFAPNGQLEFNANQRCIILGRGQKTLTEHCAGNYYAHIISDNIYACVYQRVGVPTIMWALITNIDEYDDIAIVHFDKLRQDDTDAWKLQQLKKLGRKIILDYRHSQYKGRVAYAPIEDGFVIRAIGSDSNAELETQEVVEWLNVFVRNEQNHPDDCWRIEKDGQFAPQILFMELKSMASFI